MILLFFYLYHPFSFTLFFLFLFPSFCTILSPPSLVQFVHFTAPYILGSSTMRHIKTWWLFCNIWGSLRLGSIDNRSIYMFMPQFYRQPRHICPKIFMLSCYFQFLKLNIEFYALGGHLTEVDSLRCCVSSLIVAECARSLLSHRFPSSMQVPFFIVVERVELRRCLYYRRSFVS